MNNAYKVCGIRVQRFQNRNSRIQSNSKIPRFHGVSSKVPGSEVASFQPPSSSILNRTTGSMFIRFQVFDAAHTVSFLQVPPALLFRVPIQCGGFICTRAFGSPTHAHPDRAHAHTRAFRFTRTCATRGASTQGRGGSGACLHTKPRKRLL